MMMRAPAQDIVTRLRCKAACPMNTSIASITFIALLSLAVNFSSAADEKTYYETDVRPILKMHCFHCHGEEKELAGGLDLRLRRLIVRGGDSGAAIVPGRSDESLLIEYISSGDMPPKEELKLSDDEIATITRWVHTGAPTSTEEQQTDPKPGELVITVAEREHWAYRPVKKPDVPQVTNPRLAPANPIDAFIARKLGEKNLVFSPPADKVQLLRRATFDLLGLPPTPEEVEQFLADESPNAYETLIDRLLGSPHYGERWGRHWLDVAGYADSEGYNDKDLIRDDAWSYRDYVIRSFNADKPWNRFLTEQIAGDELARANHQNAKKLANRDEAALEALTATGFLRLGPDGTGSRPMDPNIARNQVITETIKIVSSALLGTTIGCAECHHHRFDPIPQEDFYRMRAIFAPVYNTENWLMPKSRRIAILSEADRKNAEEIEANAKVYDAKHNKLKNEVMQLVLDRVLESIPEEKRNYAREAFETPKAKRTPEQKQFVEEQYPMVGLLRTGTLHLFLARYPDGAELKKEYEDALAKAAELREQKPEPYYIRVAVEYPKRVPQTFLFHRGDYSSPAGEPLEPAGLTLFSDRNAKRTPAEHETAGTTGRRLDYARYLTSGKHPLVARVLVNRFWHHHFGRGIVESTGDFGKQGLQPSHPELLDWLAADFMQQGWTLKRLHKLIMTSRTYRQASSQNEAGNQVDSQNRLLWRMPVRRMEAEIIRDAILSVSGQLNRERFGPPIPVATDQTGIFTVGGGAISDDKRELKRSIYIQVRRTKPVAMLEAFDSPQMEPNCERRVVSTVATQSLALLNSNFILQQADAFAQRTLADTGVKSKLTDRITRAWQRAYSRKPKPVELRAATEYLKQQQTAFAAAKVKAPAKTALASLCQVLLCSNEFLYVD